MSKKYKVESAKLIFHRFLTGEESGGEWRAFCPACEEPGVSKSASASFNLEKGVWNCQGKCSRGGKIYDLAHELNNDPKSDFRIQSEKMRAMNKKNGPPNQKPAADETGKRISPTVVAKAHENLLKNKPALNELQTKRGLTKETIVKYQIGYERGRYTIPVMDKNGGILNIRLYNMSGSGSDKMRNTPGYGAARLYNQHILENEDTVVLCEGEMDCLILLQNGIPALTATAGAATFFEEWGEPFKDKIVYVCYDNDDAGEKGAMKAGKIIAGHAKEVYQIRIPIPVKGADVTDMLHSEGQTARDFRQLMEEAKPLELGKTIATQDVPDKGKKVDLEESMAQNLQREVLEMKVTVSGKRNPPFEAPKLFTVKCNFNKGKICEDCPLMSAAGDLTVEMSASDPQLVNFVDTPKDRQPKLMKEASGALCTTHNTVELHESYYLEELVVGNSIEDRTPGREQTPVTRDVYSVGTHATPVNSTVEMLGRNATNPKNSRVTFQAWKVEPVQTSLDKFELTKEMRNELSVFQQNEDQTPLEKCIEIAHEMSANVTRIYDRDLLHVAYDLVWHSPLSFEVEGKMVDKGWLEMMAIGDTRTGKSETAIRLAEYYNAGIVKSCEGATFAGLVGGVQQMGNGAWITTWGVIPLNDRRLVVLDEVSGLKDKDVIENMSSIRSMGVAQITKINTQETSARTRLIWITNPGDGMMIEERPDVGIGALRTVVKTQEDIARFDFVVAALASEVDPETINSSKALRPTHPLYPSEFCSSLVLWAWSLKPDQIKFTDTAVKEARRIASGIADEYVADPPLIQAENIRFKLYRIAAAIAARTFAIKWPERGKMQLTVTKDHIKSAKEFLDLIYDNPGMEYRSASRTIISARQRAKKFRMAAKTYLIEYSDTVLATLRAVSQDSRWKGRDFEEFGGMSRDEAAMAMKKLQMWGMVHRKPQGYVVMDKMLVSILRELEREDI